ncbi:YgfZ/GcvT domain-containing protein [uncultured Jatrophihabitans sp.]|uniref:CAF17-like 4Fe-4S cluster assembly/insertion protein YgfZ n=1 Tax=uncultured Jatrophihabitans sp. TaxID=1610747 RepID=UPI0035CC1184
MTSNLERAVLGTGRDAGVPWHYGDPLAEQRRAVRGAGVVQRDRDVVTVSGVDRLGWLHSITSQHFAALADGDAVESLVLSPHGHVEQHWQATELGGTVWIDTEAGEGPEVIGYLQKMIFMKRVEPLDVSADWGVVSVVGPQTATVLAAAGYPVPDRPGRAVSLPAGGFVRRMSWPTDDAADLLVPAGQVTDTVAALAGAGAEPIGLWAFEALRVEARRPRLKYETDHRTIPHEVGWINRAVHLDKGCYRGQETVARVHNLGRPPRRLVLVHLAGESDELPEPGTPVESAGRTVGFIGTALHHHELGPVALAVVKRSLATDAPLEVDGSPVAVDDDPVTVGL